MMNSGATHVASFTEFWPIYLEAHSDRRCRALHYVGTVGAALCLVLWAVTGNFWFAPASLVVGYGFAWSGHGLFEKNKPLSFNYPWMSLRADFVMLFEAATGRLRLPGLKADPGSGDNDSVPPPAKQ